MKKYLKYIFIVLIILFALWIIIKNNNKYNKSIANIKNDFAPMLGDIGGGFILNSNVVNFTNTNMASKNVQNAVLELYDSLTDGCAPGYSKGTAGTDSYPCNARTTDATQTEVFGANLVKYDNTNSGLLSTNVDDAIVELADMIRDCKTGFVKSNETSSSYDCVDICATSNVTCSTTNGSWSKCSVTYQDQSGTHSRTNTTTCVSTVQENHVCSTTTSSESGSCNGATRRIYVQCECQGSPYHQMAGCWVATTNSCDTWCNIRCKGRYGSSYSGVAKTCRSSISGSQCNW